MVYLKTIPTNFGKPNCFQDIGWLNFRGKVGKVKNMILEVRIALRNVLISHM